MKTTPLVILLDIDGTLLGDISPQVIMYELGNRLKGQTRLPFTGKHIEDRLQSGVVRPYFKSFIKDLQEYGVEFFIYTASEKKWAEYIIKLIEKSNGVKFNRPLFTRDNCDTVNGEVQKSIQRVLPQVVKTLKKKYPGVTQGSLRNMVMAVDNTQVYNASESKFLLHCKTYDFMYPENIPSYISKPVFDKHNDMVMAVLTNYIDCMRSTSNYFKFQKCFYQYYVESLNRMMQPSSSQDALFKILRVYIIKKNITSFSESVVKYLNKKITSNKYVDSFF